MKVDRCGQKDRREFGGGGKREMASSSQGIRKLAVWLRCSGWERLQSSAPSGTLTQALSLARRDSSLIIGQAGTTEVDRLGRPDWGTADELGRCNGGGHATGKELRLQVGCVLLRSLVPRCLCTHVARLFWPWQEASHVHGTPRWPGRVGLAFQRRYTTPRKVEGGRGLLQGPHAEPGPGPGPGTRRVRREVGFASLRWPLEAEGAAEHSASTCGLRGASWGGRRNGDDDTGTRGSKC